MGHMRITVLLCVLFSSCLAFAQVPQTVVSVRPSDIIDVRQIDPTILVEMMYFSNGNFVGKTINGYKSDTCYLTKIAAEGLKNAQARLKVLGAKNKQTYSLLVRDCYRPQKAVKHFVDWSNDAKDIALKSVFYPELEKTTLIKDGYISPTSGHSRGSTVDLTIVRMSEQGEWEPLNMGTPVDFFSEKSHTDSKAISASEAANRKILLDVMGVEFKNYSKEWWHYVLKTEVYPNTFFDFDVENSSLKVNGTAAEFATQLTEPALLAELDRNNASPLALTQLLRLVHQSNGLTAPTVDNADHAKGSILASFKDTYGVFASVISADIARIITELNIDWEKDITKTYDVSAAKTAAGKENRKNGNVTRIFNEKWLTSPTGQFILMGVVNRMDRRDFTPGTCGEVRFIYRLAYETQMKGKTYASRMPTTLNMVFNYKDEGQSCLDLAKRWKIQVIKNDDPVLVTRRLLAGPLDFSKLSFKQMEFNSQVARFPSDLENVEQRRFAGQAIYLMRIFNLQQGRFVARKLENTPDVQAILKSADKQKQLRDFIAANMGAVDTGVYLLPDSLLADVAISYSTLGSSRVTNRPFDLLLKPEELDKMITDSRARDLRFVGSGRGLLERLNTSTCMGCHQSSSTAGFHFLGADRSDFGLKPAETKTALDGNRLVLPFSYHLSSELSRRAQYVAQLSNGQKPNNFRPHPSSPPGNWTLVEPTFTSALDNMPCPLSGDSALAPAVSWKCDANRNLTCAALVTNASQSSGLGQCIPPSNAIYSGLSCRKNKISDQTATASFVKENLLAYNVKSFMDHVTTDEQLYKLTEGSLDADHFNCRPTRIGVPLGRVTKACTPNQKTLKNVSFSPVPDEMCAVVGGKGFEEMAKGYFDSKKFADGVGRGVLNTCSPSRFCREDYICQEMPDFLTGDRFGVSPATIKTLRLKKIGFCTPTYFVYQLRLDGHPNPL
jgi:D-alanyl-D-alanine dipeptidase